jgi:SAM-dependent methyltransferase
MLYDGSSTAEEFVTLGENFVRHILIPRAGLGPVDIVLDLGCGNGGIARALTGVLASNGRYEGLDVNRSGVLWLQDRYQRFDRFRFTHANVRNRMYNPQGDIEAGSYRLPFPDGAFSVVVLKSVFTHMVPVDVRHYLDEVSRVLQPGGRAVITYFLLNREAQRFIDGGLASVPMPFDHGGDALCRVANPDVPEQAIAHDEQRVRAFYAEANLAPCEIVFGNWSGRPSLLGLQDLIIAFKP